MVPNYYAALSISSDSTSEQIKKQYRLLALKYHPDKNKASDAHETFIKIHEAYETLMDVELRKIYDKLYNSHYSNQTQTAPLPAATESERTRYDKWEKEAKTKAKYYAEMHFNDFKTKVLGQVIVVYDRSKTIVKILISVAILCYWIFMIATC